MAMFGVDISHYQMDNGFNPAKIEADFIICKATQGTTYKDKTMTKALDEASKSGKLIGVYHFADGKSTGKKEADFFISVVKPYIGKALLVLDWEADALKKGPGYALDFCNRVYSQTKVKPILYCSLSTITSAWESFAKKYPYVWFAKYGADPVVKGYNKNPSFDDSNVAPFKKALFQYSSNTYLKGYSARLDADKCYIDKTKWKKLASKESDDKKDDKPTPKLSVDEVAKKIINGEDGWKIYGAARVNKLKSLGYNPDEVQKRINELLKEKDSKDNKKDDKKDKATYYTVKKGDTFSSIATKYKLSVYALQKLNPSIKNINVIHVGDKIRVK